MSNELDDIWDEPATVAPSAPRPPAPSSPEGSPEPGPSSRPKRRQPLFLGASDSDDDAPVAAKAKPTKSNAAAAGSSKSASGANDDLDPDIEALFDITPLKAIDTDQLQREANEKYKNAKHSFAASRSAGQAVDALESTSSPNKAGSGKRGGKKGKDDDDEPAKERKKIVRLDEGKLLGPTGFPQLIKYTKDFKIKGKGHETQDLNRLMQVYQFWTHEMYPKTTFKDTVNRVEKLCHSKRMNVALSVWRDEAMGIKHPENESDNSNSDEDGDGDVAMPKAAAATTDRDSSPEARPPSSRPSSVPPSDMETTFEDDDIEALIRAEEEAERAAAAASKNQPQQQHQKRSSMDMDIEMDDEELQKLLDEASGFAPVPPPNKAAPPPGDDFDDQDMWDIMAEVEKEQQQVKQPAVPQPPPPPNPAPIEEDWGEDLYI